MASLLALGQKGALGHLIGKLLRAGAMGDRSLENFAHAQKELFELVRREPVHSRSGIDASLKQDLIRIDISDSGDDLLIHQDRFDIAFAAQYGRFERRQIQARIECVRPQLFSRDEVGRIFNQAYTPDHSFVGVSEAAVIGEIEAHAREGRFLVRLGDEMERARHTEMQGQPTAAIDTRKEVLAISPGGNKASASKAADECLRSELAQDTLVAYDDPLDRLAQSASCEHALENLDVWQFRHFTDRLLRR